MTTTPAIRVSEASTRAQLADAVKAQRAKAERLSRHDPRRWAIDDTVDDLVTLWLAAEG